jgi:signal transduction histidine kinase
VVLGATVRGLSAAVARVRAGPFDIGEDDYEAWTIPGSRGHRALVARVGGYLAIVIGIYIPIMVVVSDASPATDRIGIALGAFAFLTGVLMTRHAAHIPIWLDDVLGVLASALLVIAGRRGGAFAAGLPGIYVIVGTILFAIRGWAAAGLHLVAFGISYGIVVSTTDGYAAPLTWWIAVMVAVVSCGGFVRWLVRNVGDLVVAEHDAREKAEEASAGLVVVSRAKSEFLARMSHELRTPLNAILGFADVLRDQLVGPLNERQVSYVDDIAESGRHLLALVDDVLDLSRVESGAIPLDIRPLDVGRTLEDARRMLRQRSALHGIRVSIEVDPRVPIIEADERKMRQVVVNLLANAVKFTPRGGRVIVTARPGASGGVRIAVEDTGVGIAPDDIERIFEQFEQVAGVTEGTGLGLPLARRLVELHGGRLWAESTPGRGSTFAFELPRRPATAPTAPVTSVEPAGDADDEEGDDGPDTYEAFLVPGSAKNREVITRTGQAFSAIAAGLAVVIAAVTPGEGGTRLAVGALALAALVFALAVARLGRSMSMLALEAMPILGTIAISVLAWVAFPFASVVALAYGWITLTRFSLWDRGRAVVQIVLIAVCYGVVLLGHPEAKDRDARWLGLLILLLVNGLVARWIVGKLRLFATAEREARRMAEQVEAQLAATSAHKSDFLASMSHELRTPLNAIIGFSDVLRQGIAGPLDDRQRAYVDDIADAGTHLLALINDILDLAKLEAGQLQLALEPLLLPALIEDALAVVRPEAQARAVELAASCPEDAFIVGDAHRLEQILVDLLENAVKFTADGGAVNVRADVSGDEVHIAVSDTGIGIHPTSRRAIFDAFQQGGREAPLPARDGTGLGLALAKGLVELHGGRIWVESEPGVGSTFTVAMAVSREAAMA